MDWTSGNSLDLQNILIPFSIRLLSTGYTLTIVGSIVTMIIASFNSWDVTRDLAKAEFHDNESVFDFIVVGGGSAGSVVTARLSEDINYKVLLLEAGGEPNPLTDIPVLASSLLNQPYVDWRFQTQPQSGACLAMNDGKANWPRGLGLGGSSNLNIMVYARGHPKDFDGWARITGDRRWEYGNVLNFFKKSENYLSEFDNPTFHSKGGPLTVSRPDFPEGAELGETLVRAANEKGFSRIDINAPYTEGFGPIDSTLKNGRRASTFRAFLEPVRKRKNLSIYKFSRVHKILFRTNPDSTLEAYGVEYMRHGLKRTAFARKEVVISAGAVMSPHILMHSGIGPWSQLKENKIEIKLDRPGVGSNLQDHIFGLIGPFLIDKPLSILFDRDLLSLKNAFNYLGSGSGPLGSPATPAMGFFVSSSARASLQDFDYPDIQLTMQNYGVASILDVAFGMFTNVPAEKFRKFFGSENFGKDGFFIINALVRPKSRGKIVLDSPDPEAYPLIHAGYYTHPDDITVIVEGARRITDLVLNSTAFRPLNARLPNLPFPGCEEYSLWSDPYWECFHRQLSLTLYHPVGTCSMGKIDDPYAVVNSELIVIGTSNLRVMDASVMPVITNANTNAPTIMIGEMGAEFIKQRWSEYKPHSSNQV